MQDMEQIYKQYFETVYKYLFCLTHNRNISEELTQETFYRAVKKIGTYKDNCKISVWLCQIAKNLWYDECRKNKKLSHLLSCITVGIIFRFWKFKDASYSKEMYSYTIQKNAKVRREN